jgi:hypothetical protein
MTGALISWFLIPDRDADLSGEDDAFRRYLLSNGYVGQFGAKWEMGDADGTEFWCERDACNPRDEQVYTPESYECGHESPDRRHFLSHRIAVSNTGLLRERITWGVTCTNLTSVESGTDGIWIRGWQYSDSLQLAHAIYLEAHINCRDTN